MKKLILLLFISTQALAGSTYISSPGINANSCSSNKFANGILTDGTLSCATPSGGGGGGISTINTDATADQILGVGTAGTDFGIVDNGTGTHTFNLPSASGSARGVVTTGSQTIAGAKTFSSQIVGSTSGNLLPASNLSDVSSASTSRTNLGAAASATTVSAGIGLSGGGDLSANRTLTVNNGYSAIKTSGFTATYADGFKTYQINTTSGGFSVNLPAASTSAGVPMCFHMVNYNVESNPVTFVRNGSDTIGTLAQSKIYYTNGGTICLAAASGGTDWYNAGLGTSILTKQILSGSGTWVAQAFVSNMTIIGRGGSQGGAGGSSSGSGAIGTAASNAASAGGAGSCPGMSTLSGTVIAALTPGTSYPYQVGAAGTGGAGGTGGAVNPAGSIGAVGAKGLGGGNSTFGSLATFAAPASGTGGQLGGAPTFQTGGAAATCTQVSGGNSSIIPAPIGSGGGSTIQTAGICSGNAAGAWSFFKQGGLSGSGGSSGTGFGGGGGCGASPSGGDNLSTAPNGANGGNGGFWGAVGSTPAKPAAATNGMGGAGGGGAGGSGGGIIATLSPVGSATDGATYTNNAITYTVRGTVASSASIIFSGSGYPTSSGTFTKASGTGDATLTFTSYTTTAGANGGDGGDGSPGLLTLIWSE